MCLEGIFARLENDKFTLDPCLDDRPRVKSDKFYSNNEVELGPILGSSLNSGS